MNKPACQGEPCQQGRHPCPVPDACQIASNAEWHQHIQRVKVLVVLWGAVFIVLLAAGILAV